jgi:FixJ family two-component response regulator
MTGHGDIPMSVRAMKAGAVDTLVEGFQLQQLNEYVIALPHEFSTIPRSDLFGYDSGC